MDHIRHILSFLYDAVSKNEGRDSEERQSHINQSYVAVSSFIEQHIDEFEEDTKLCKMTGSRISCGKLEKKLFILVCELIGYSTRKEYVKLGERLFISLGYKSYEMKEHRFKYKVDNSRKKILSQHKFDKIIKSRG